MYNGVWNKKRKTGKLSGPRLLSDAATQFPGSCKHNTPIWSGLTHVSRLRPFKKCSRNCLLFQSAGWGHSQAHSCSSGLMKPWGEGGGQQKGCKGNRSAALPLPTVGSKAGSCSWAGLCLWARKEQTCRHATHLVTPARYFHAAPYPAWTFCCYPSKAPQSPSCTLQSM